MSDFVENAQDTAGYSVGIRAENTANCTKVCPDSGTTPPSHYGVYFSTGGGGKPYIPLDEYKAPHRSI